jgi:uncharacterized membrane protein
MGDLWERRSPGTVALIDGRPGHHRRLARDLTPPVAHRPVANVSNKDGFPRSLGRARRLGWVLIALQLVGMFAFSTFQYSRFALTTDFGAYAQVLWKISHGSLNPWSSLFSSTFWKNEAEFVMWPLALLYRAYPHPVLLLWVQDLAVAATEIVALGWIVDVVRTSKHRLTERQGALLAAGAAVVMVVNPWVYETIAFDFHSEPLAAFFLILVGRDLWAGRGRRLWLWVAGAMLCGVLAATYLIGVGVAGVMAGRRTRRRALLIGAAGTGWFLFLTSIGASGLDGRLFDSGYGYLVGAHAGHVSIVTIVVGVVSHPNAVVHMLASRWGIVFEFLVVAGFVGVFSPWGAGMAFVVFVPSILDSSPNFLSMTASFQSWPALPFILVGSVMVIIHLASGGQLAKRMAVAALAATVASLSVFAVTALPAVSGQWIAVDAPAATQLARAGQWIPSSAEVVASQGVVGRFSDHDDVYGYPDVHPLVRMSYATFPVRASPVIFVLTPAQGVGEVTKADAYAAVTFVEDRLRARVLDAHSGVYVLEWRPPRDVTSVTLP